MNKEEYKLCYIKDNKAWFTNDFENQWGDDWNDRPYEYNAGEPYDDWQELIEDNEDIFKRKWKTHFIKHKTLYFEAVENIYIEQPCDIGNYTVEEINKKLAPWIHTDNYDIFAETTYEEFIKIIIDNGGIIYVPKGINELNIKEN